MADKLGKQVRRRISEKILASLDIGKANIVLEIELSALFYNLALIPSAELTNQELATLTVEPSDIKRDVTLDRVQNAWRAYHDLPIEVRTIVEKAANNFDMQVSPDSIGFWLHNADQIASAVEIDLTQNFWERSKGGRPPGMTKVSSLIAEQAIAAKTRSKESWANIADILIEGWRTKGELTSEEQQALMKIEEAKGRLNRQGLEDYIWSLVKRYQENTRK